MKWEMIVGIISLIISLGITLFLMFLTMRRNNSKVNKDNKVHINESAKTLKSRFSKNSEIGELIDSIQLWELTNRGEVHSKEQEEAEAEKYSIFLKSDMYLKLSRIMEEHDGSGS